MCRLRTHIFLLLAFLATMAHAQHNTVGVYCPMDFNGTFTQETLTNQFRQSIERTTTLEGIGIGPEVKQMLYSEGYFGDEIDAVIDVARSRGLKKVMLLVFSGSDSQFMLLDPLSPDTMESLSASLPEDITRDEFEDIFNQVASALLQDYAANNATDLNTNITKL